MNIRLQKVAGDLKSNLGRSILVVFALFLGIWGVGSIAVSYTVLNHDLNQNYLQTDPAHAVLTSRQFTKTSLADIRGRNEIETAEFRDFALLRIEVNPDEWIPLLLYGVEDFHHFNVARLAAQAGPQDPPTGTMLVERDGLKISQLSIGKPARIRSGAANLEIPISGICFDPAQAPATQDHFIYGYVSKATFALMTGGLVDQRLIVRYRNAVSTRQVQNLTDTLVRDLGATGVSIDSVSVPKLNEHPHQWQLNTLLFIIGTIGFLAFVMGAVLVSQLMNALLASQVRQIGIFKAIGASQGNILPMYLILLVFFGLVAGALAIPLAVSTGYSFSYFVAGILNFEILSKQVPVHLLLLLFVVSITLPILLSLPAVLKGIRVSVLAAFSDQGIKKEFARDIFGGMPLPTSLKLALRNTLRKPRRFFVTIVALSLGVAIFSTGFNVRQSLTDLLSSIKNSMNYDVQVVLTNAVPRTEALAPFGNLTNVARSETWNGGRGELQSRVVSTREGVGVIALPWDSDLIKFRIVAGHWLAGDNRPEIVLNQQALETFHNPQVGDTLSLDFGNGPVNLTLIGIVEEFDKAKIYMDESRFNLIANPRQLINSVMFVAQDHGYESVLALKRQVERAVETSGLSVLYVMSQAERVKVIFDHLNIVLSTIIMLAVLVLSVSALGMASATGISVLERTREIGVMRAIGAKNRDIARLFVTEGLILSLIGLIFGLLLAWPLSIAASYFFGTLMLGEGSVLRFSLSWDGVGITLISSLIFGYLASRIPAGTVIRTSTAKALAYE